MGRVVVSVLRPEEAQNRAGYECRCGRLFGLGTKNISAHLDRKRSTTCSVGIGGQSGQAYGARTERKLWFKAARLSITRSNMKSSARP